jgi:hypothetical protein
MIRPGFLESESRRDLIELARDGSTAHRLGRRANALVLLDDGMSCSAVAKVLFLDDDTVRTWYQLYQSAKGPTLVRDAPVPSSSGSTRGSACTKFEYAGSKHGLRGTRCSGRARA